MIKLSVQPQQFVDADGKPIAGRVSFFKHGSNELAQVYWMEGNDFVDAQNPQLLNAMGSIDRTVFFDADILDMKVERYIGEPGAMTVHSTEYATFDEFEVGMDYKAMLEQSGTVYSIAELKEVDPEQFKVVEVQSAPFRRYVWDEHATNNADDGVVVMSDVTSDGRWLLLWDDEMLPSSIYGVEAGNFANLVPLLSYPAVVGSIGLRTPPVVRMMLGTYNTTTWVSTTKTIAFSEGVRFTGGGFVCPRVIQLSGMDNYFADLELSDNSCPAHSSWFRTLAAFWLCGSKEIHIDDTNYFEVTQVTGQFRIDNAVIMGAKRIACTYATGACLFFTGCAFSARGIFSPKLDYVKFGDSGWYDDIWNTNQSVDYDFGKIADGHHVEFLASGLNSQSLNQFKNTMTYIKMREAQQASGQGSNPVLDMEGRTLTSFSSAWFGKLRNCHVTGNINLANAPAGFHLENVTCDGQINGGTNLVLINVTAALNVEWTGSLTAYNSMLSGSKVTGAHDITISGGYWRKSIDNVTDNVTNPGTVIFRDCVLDGMNVKIRTKNLNIIRCGVYEQTIEVYPVWDSGLNAFLFNGRLEDSEISGATPIAYKIVHGLGDNCKDCILVYTWIGNSFFGNTDGMTFEFWADSTVLAEVLARSGHSVVYSGNKGYCPLEAWHGTYGPISWTSCAFYPADGDPTSPMGNFYRAALAVRCCPPWNGSISNIGTYGNWMGPSYQITGGATTKGFSAATNPMPTSLGYGDVFGSYFVRYGGSGDSALIYV